MGAGELFYYPGSHRFPDFLYGGRYKSIVEAARCGNTVERDEVEMAPLFSETNSTEIYEHRGHIFT